ncbi:MAG: hypothetical protein IPN29_18465 [Saprospiraceae bacterium]|nr:hypothetical protein [Saprospiraceae bacterium]
MVLDSNKRQKSIFEMNISPFRLVIWTILGALFFQIIVSIFNRGESAVFFQRTHYTIVLSFLMVFSMFCAVLSLSSKDEDNYWWKSLAAYTIQAIVGGLTAYAFTGLSPDEAGPFRWMFFVFTFGFILLLAIFRTMRFLMGLAQKEDRRIQRGE